MKIFLAQQNYHIGNIEANTAKIIEAIIQAKEQHGDVILFSELSVCGYPPRDFLEYPEFIEHCEAAAQKIAAASIGIAISMIKRKAVWTVTINALVKDNAGRF